MNVRQALVLAALAAAFPALPLWAQQADVIRGRILGDDGQGIENAIVQAVSIPNNVNKTARTDKTGRYAIALSGGDGDYWITVSAIGYAARRFELKRVADEDVLIGDAKLTRAGVTLDAVKVQAERTKPGRNDNAKDISGTEKSVGIAAVDPNQAGNLAAMAASLPGVQFIPGADGNPDQFSVFGLSGDQNSTSLNGLGYAGAEIPRDATAKTSLVTSPWDVSRGGFSGGQFGLRTQSGSNFSSRGASGLLNAPPLEWTDRAGRASGVEYSALSFGAATSGPVAMDRSFYSAGYQIDRRTSNLPSLLSASPLALGTAGVALDSVARLRGILGQLGVPVTTDRLPTNRTIDHASFLTALDFSPPSSTSGQSVNVTASGSFNRVNMPFSQVTAVSTADAQRTNWFGSVQARHTDYIGFGVLTETSVGVSRAREYTDPYLALPTGYVRVSSTLDDGAGISQLAFGGNPAQSTSSTNSAVGAINQLSWFTLDNKHRLKLSTELRRESYDQDANVNRLGVFAYNSLADLGAGRPASFSRLLSPQRRGGSEIAGAISLGDSYRPAADLQIQYGVRLDGNYFAGAPERNAAIQQAFGIDNAVVPSRVYVSPRAGFSWTYGQAAQLAIGDGFMRGPRAVVRGGVGLFQGVPRAQLVGGAMANTGLADATQQLVCVGSAVPMPDWGAYLGNPAAIPTRCANGSAGTVFSSVTPNVVLFDRAYRAPRSLRSNLNWTGSILGDRLAAAVDATYSRNLSQPGFVDLNFSPTAQFLLSNEAERPVYARSASIVATTGAIAASDARLAPGFARVTQLRSDLQSNSRQVLVGIRPLAFSTRFGWELSYVYANTRDLARGFTSTGGDPTTLTWARSPLDSRHQIVYSASYNFFDLVPVSLSGSFRSGRPFTPLVAGDVNGDGYLNDRAFVFDPAAAAADPTISAEMRSLLNGGSAAARACLARQLGRIAARNSCEAPWVATSNFTISVNPLRARLPQRMNVSLYVNNAFGAADLLLHGESKRHGWGQSADPDQSLLFVRGFDPATQRFRYDVNPRFGATSLGQTLNRNPVVVTAIVKLDVGFTRERQLLTQSLDRGRRRPGERPSDQDIKGLTGLLIPANPMALILQQADSLKLTRRQADSLSVLNRSYTLRFDAVWTPVAKFLSALPKDYDRSAAYDRYRRAREASVDMLIALAPQVRGLLTADQRRLLPSLITGSLDTRYLSAVRSSTAGGASAGVLAMLAQLGGLGSSADAQTIMIHR